ncbi:MAG: 23S rRNA (guanosine(2251)-2'-O)-methyltransferase RlmB [Actinomycetota bacterium]|nr:23S rRNA (guanosine(2251)-2'-O)-methyltransferase RlmB [Actinomycetota bacterium]
MRGEVIYGIRPVAEALRSKRREVYEVLDAVGDEVVASAAALRKVRLKRVKREHVEQLAPGTVHQGVAARVRPYPYSGLAEILTMLPDPLVVLDGVTDPRNLGAVLRVADGAGASGVVVPRHQAVGVTPAVVKASAGASEHVRVVRETNLRRALDEIKKAGVWTYAAEGGVAQAYTNLDLSGPVAFVLGSEGRGIRRLVREGCDEAISIKMHGVVSSLNVSVAAAILLFETRRQQGCRGT